MSAFLRFLNPPIVTTEPPTEADLRRTDLALFVCVLLLLGLGWIVRWAALDEGRRFELAPGLPTVAYPAGWQIATPAHEDARAPGEGLLVEAINPGAPSTYSPRIRIESLPVKQGDDLDSARIAVSLRRSRELDRYRELTAEPVLLLDNRPALLTTYAFIADPTLDAGSYGLPVVVQAQDLLFRHDNRWLLATVSADAADFTAEEPAFARFFESLALDRDVTFSETLPDATPSFEGNRP